MEHAYPQHLAAVVAGEWESVCPPPDVYGAAAFSAGDALPSAPLFERVISTCYQASLLLDEQRPVTFRLMLIDPARLPAEQGPPDGLHRLQFDEARPFNEHELRRLSQTAGFYRALIGVRVDPEEGLVIWGIIHSGPRWLRTLNGGRRASKPLPLSLVVAVTGPGRLEVDQGSVTVAKLEEGQIFGPSKNVFDSRWLDEDFAAARAELDGLHRAAREKAETVWARLDDRVTGLIAQQLLKRVVAAIRNSHHGGILVIVPPERAEELLGANPHLTLKYKFAAGEPRARFHTLMVEIMNTLAEVGGKKLKANLSASEPKPVGWREYEKSDNAALSALDEAVFETAHLIAGLAATDGAVVMTSRFEVLGFGGEIACDEADVSVVGKALDIEGARVERESVESVGTRHRSAFRFCREVRDALAVVISQDMDVRFVKWKEGLVTYWDHHASTTCGDF
jgi:hypothetical protein